MKKILIVFSLLTLSIFANAQETSKITKSLKGERVDGFIDDEANIGCRNSLIQIILYGETAVIEEMKLKCDSGNLMASSFDYFTEDYGKEELCPNGKIGIEVSGRAVCD